MSGLTIGTNTTPVLAFGPIRLPIPGRPVDLELRVSAPVSGTGLPVILLSHGHGLSNHLSSLHGYAPLVDHWTARGFVVVQPTHLTSRTLSHLVADAPGAPYFWRSRAEDMTHVLDRWDAIEEVVPQLAGRVDREKIAVAGHSLGGFTASLLLGAGLTENGEPVSVAEQRIKAGVLLAAPGRGDVLNGPLAQDLPFFRSIDFSSMTTPALVVTGDNDDSRHFTDMGPAWHADPYHLAPAPKSLITLFGAEHGLGGIAGYDAAETTDEDPARVAAVGRLTAGYLHARLGTGSEGADAWRTAREELTSGPDAIARVESK